MHIPLADFEVKKYLFVLVCWVLLLFSNCLTAANFRDSGHIRWTSECLFSANKHEENYSGKYTYYNELRYRSQYFVGIVADLQLHRKKASWLSPQLAFSAGWFKSRIFYNYHNSGWYTTPDNLVESKVNRDTFEFTSITFLPQIGLQARPFHRKRRLSRLALCFRSGFQLHWVQQLNSINNIIVEQHKMDGWWISLYSQQNTTTHPSLRQRHFPHWYFQFGLANEIKNSHLGYRLSYSWQQQAQQGMELSLTWRLH